MKDVILKLILPALLLGLVFNMSLQAATTGKITGMVTDKINGSREANFLVLRLIKTKISSLLIYIVRVDNISSRIKTKPRAVQE